jgi:cation diffusion facilitator CzcD-associated flavoprotein CzcO
MTATNNDYDVIIIGAGLSGLYQLHKVRELGMSVRVFEAGTDVGGTWYWNRYPGARFDSESWSYGYSWSKELLQEWEWTEHFSAQPETLRYVNYVADKFELRKDISFNARVQAATYDSSATCWNVELEDGEKASARYLITAIGVLSTPVMPTIKGSECFTGRSFHTAEWPHEPVDFSGQRVAVIGTGATGVQTIQEVAKTAGQLTVFQRTPNYCAPLNNSPIDATSQANIKANYDDIFARCRESHGQFIHNADPRYAMQLSADERNAVYEKLYGEPGFGIWMGNFRDTFTDEAANKTISDFVAGKIRERVSDPKTAEKLIPTDHGFGTRRVPLETNYYEVYNQDNVQLVDIRETPIQQITETGIETSATTFDFDIIIFATGFNAVVGSFEQMQLHGEDGVTLKDKWRNGPRTLLGLQTAGFPNLFTLVGPHNAATFCNIPRCIEQNVEWVADALAFLQRNNYTRMAATRTAEDEWTQHVIGSAQKLLLSKTRSWFTGINPNLPGKQEKTFMLYAGGAPSYRKKCEEVAANGYVGFDVA